MATLIRITKLYDAKAYEPIDFGPWLASINDQVGSITVGDAPDVIETYTVSGSVVELVLSGGERGRTYRLPVTCVSAAKALPRTVVVELSIPGVAASTSGGSSGGTAGPGNLDGGGPDTNYTSIDPIDGGTI